MAGARQLADVRVGDVLGDVPCRVGEPGAEQGLPATQEQDRRGDRPEHFGVGRPGPVIGRVLLDEAEHRRDAARPSIVEVRLLQGGNFGVGADPRGERANRIHKPAVGGRRTHLLHGRERAGEVVVAHHRHDAGLVRGHGGHGPAARGRAEHPRSATRPADQADRLADAVHERGDVLLQARGRVVRVVARQPAAAGARQVAGEPVGEVGEQGLPGDVAVPDPAVDQDQRRPPSPHSSGDFGAVGGDGSVDPLVSHAGSSGAIAAPVFGVSTGTLGRAAAVRHRRD